MKKLSPLMEKVVRAMQRGTKYTYWTSVYRIPCDADPGPIVTSSTMDALGRRGIVEYGYNASETYLYGWELTAAGREWRG